ncbi:hypothetical protein pb186bvf_010612 [Paramecium bursaria]
MIENGNNYSINSIQQRLLVLSIKSIYHMHFNLLYLIQFDQNLSLKTPLSSNNLQLQSEKIIKLISQILFHLFIFINNITLFKQILFFGKSGQYQNF